ncbi:MAG: hypothetical protein RL226_339, partial [Bacteroidota bacterium]
EITLYAVSPGGCVDSISHTFHPFIDLYIPSGFTPNNDGINDYFQAKGHDIIFFEITVFNRWGDVVYFSNSLDEIWTGDVKGGDYYGQNEVYNYTVRAIGVRLDAIEKSGTITIVR